jgi:hypothetical protein
MSGPSQSESQRRGKPKIVYVMGAGRSGSTIFGVALGNCADIFDAGEMEAWLRRSGVPNFGGTDRMRFWAGIREDVEGADLYGDQAWLCIEHSSSLLRVDRWPARRQLRSRYRQIADELYRAIIKASGVTNVVDTSHYPLRVRELQALGSIDLYLIYLVRDPHSVVASFDKRDVDQQPKAPLATNIYLWVTHLLAVSIFLQHRRDRRCLVRYEDFIRDPHGILRDILRRVGISADVPDLSCLKTGIPFQGNRLLTAEVLPLHSNPVRELRRRRITTLLQFPWAIAHSRLRPIATPHHPTRPML